MKKYLKVILGCLFLLCFSVSAWAQVVSALRVEENNEIVSEHILRAVKTKVGDQLNQQTVMDDIQAIYDGDPSAKTYSEIVLSFPGFLAVFMYRTAHELYELYVPIIPRVICEYAHRETGVDINPGAKIGEYFCIDHGTGVVIGETATVGDHVRIYHGVTLGVRSFRKDEEGHLIKGGKRHPDIGNNVIIYANATVLGGDTFIEDGSVIPANALIMQTPEKYK